MNNRWTDGGRAAKPPVERGLEQWWRGRAHSREKPELSIGLLRASALSKRIDVQQPRPRQTQRRSRTPGRADQLLEHGVDERKVPHRQQDPEMCGQRDRLLDQIAARLSCREQRPGALPRFEQLIALEQYPYGGRRHERRLVG